MKKFLLGLGLVALAAGTGRAADIAVPSYDWTGVYVGGQVIADFTKFNEARPLNLASSTNLGAGLNAQYLRQNNHLVFGLAASTDLFAADATKACLVGTGYTCQSGSSWDGSLRAKLGLASGRALVYGTAGWGWSSLYNNVWNQVGAEQSDRVLANGWVAGAGISYALKDRWIGSVEYLHYDLGSANFNAYGTALTKPKSDTVSLSLSYKF